MAEIGALTVYTTDESGKVVALLPGDEVPSWAVVGEHALVGARAHAEPATVGTVSPLAAGDGPPPTSGAGSSREHWVAYASANGVTVAPTWKRDQIIEAVHAAGLRVE